MNEIFRFGKQEKAWNMERIAIVTWNDIGGGGQAFKKLATRFTFRSSQYARFWLSAYTPREIETVRTSKSQVAPRRGML